MKVPGRRLAGTRSLPLVNLVYLVVMKASESALVASVVLLSGRVKWRQLGLPRSVV